MMYASITFTSTDNFNKMVSFLQILFSKVYILLTAIYLSDVTNSQMCFYQEGQPYEVFVDLKIPNNITQINCLTSSQIQALSCSACSCYNYPSSPFQASVICSNNFIDNSTLVVVHEDRNFVQSFFPFKCAASGQVFFTSCQTAVIYVSPQNNTCNPPFLSTDGKDVSFVCTTQKTYPAAKCLINSHNKTYTNTTCTSTSYTISGNEYMTTTCSFVTEVGGLQLGTNVFSAYLYPDLINGTQFAVRANNLSIDLTLPLAGLAKCRNDSTDYIKLGDSYSCECTKSTPGNLPAKFQWYDEKNQALGTGLLTRVANISGVTSKIFKCQPQYTWNSTFSGASIIFVAKFSYGPTNATIQRVDNSSPIDIYNLCPTTGNITLVCHVMKATVNPEPSITMYQNNLPLSFSTQHNSSSYNYISSFQPRSAGVLVFGCLVENSKYRENKVNGSLQVLVRAPPINKPELKIAEVHFYNNQAVLEENKTYDVSCNVEGGVDVLIQCGQLTNKTTTAQATLSLQSVSRDLNMQNCTCTAQHITGCYTNNTNWYILNVTYKANVTHFTANNEVTELTVDMNSTLDLACKTDGNPIPNYSITRESGHTFTNLHEHNFTARCNDSGVYTCSASNFLSTSNRSVSVYVTCSAELVNSTDNYKNYSFNYGENATIEVIVFGYPFPLLKEIHINHATYNNSFLNLTTNQKNSTDEFSVEYKYYKGITTILYTIQNITDPYFANYTMVITNSEGSLQYHFEIVKNTEISVDKYHDTNEDLPAAIGGAIGAATLLAGVIIATLWFKKEGIGLSHYKRGGETETSNFDIYNFDGNQLIQDNTKYDIYGKKAGLPNDPKLKDYTTIVTTLTTATARPKNMTSDAVGDVAYANFT